DCAWHNAVTTTPGRKATSRMIHLISVSPLFFTARSLEAGSRPVSFAVSRNFGRTPRDIATRRWNPTITVADGAPRSMREGPGAPSLSPMASSADNGDTRTLRKFVNEILKHWRNRGRMRADAADGRVRAVENRRTEFKGMRLNLAEQDEQTDVNLKGF